MSKHKWVWTLLFILPLWSATAAPETIVGTWTPDTLHVVLPFPGVLVAKREGTPDSTHTDFYSFTAPWEADIPKGGDYKTASLVNGRYYELVAFGEPIVLARIERQPFVLYLPTGAN